MFPSLYISMDSVDEHSGILKVIVLLLIQMQITIINFYNKKLINQQLISAPDISLLLLISDK